jgi:hypothetical protein
MSIVSNNIFLFLNARRAAPTGAGVLWPGSGPVDIFPSGNFHILPAIYPGADFCPLSAYSAFYDKPARVIGCRKTIDFIEGG